MKSINIDQVDIEFLKKLGKKMNEQSSRSTQFPTFVVKQKVKNYCGEWGNEKERREDDDYCGLCEECDKLMEENNDLPDFCDNCDSNLFVNFNWEDKIVEECGVFFTAEAAQLHIDQNHYHYCEPFVFGIPSWRNPEMQQVLGILSRIGSENGALSQYE